MLTFLLTVLLTEKCSKYKALLLFVNSQQSIIKKKEILEELDFYNVNEGSLFPELEHQMTYIKNAQTKRTFQTVGQFSRIEYVDTSLETRLPVISDLKETDVIKIFEDIL